MAECVGGILTIAVPTTARIRDVVGVQGSRRFFRWDCWQAITRIIWGLRALVKYTFTSLRATTTLRMTECVGSILTIAIPSAARIGYVLWVKLSITLLCLPNRLKASRRNRNSEKDRRESEILAVG